MGIEIIGKLTQKNNGDFKLVDLADVDYDGTGKSAKQELENKIEEAKNSQTPYDDTEVKTDINNIKTNLGTEELTTTSKKIKGAINELSSQIKENTNVINNIKLKVDSVASGSPKGVYETVDTLRTAFPNGNDNIYVVSADGGWYYWNDTTWTKGGTYQGAVIADKSITPNKNISTYIPNYKELTSYTINSYTTSLYVIDTILEKGEN